MPLSDTGSWNLQWQAWGEKDFYLNSEDKPISLTVSYKVTNSRIFRDKSVHISIYIQVKCNFFNTDKVVTVAKLTQTSGWSLIRNLFLLKLSLRTLDQLKVLIFVLPWIKTIKSLQKFQKNNRANSFAGMQIHECAPKAFCSHSGNNITLDNYIY